MATNENAKLDRFDTTGDAQDQRPDDERPEECQCEPLGALPCFTCFLAGFETAAESEDDH